MVMPEKSLLLRLISGDIWNSLGKKFAEIARRCGVYVM
jgi:hypothetical protein